MPSQSTSSSGSHDPLISEATIYYTFTSATEKPLDLHKAATRLLKSGVAETVCSPAEGEVRVSPRYRQLAKLHRKATRLQESQRLLSEGQFRSLITRHPLMAMRVAASIGRSLLRGEIPQEDVVEEDTSPDDSTLDEAIELIERSVAARQSVSGAQHAIESTLLRSAYRDSEPYLRLLLRPSRHWLIHMAGGTQREIDDFGSPSHVEALLLIHRSGVLQITFALTLPENLKGSAFSAFTFGGNLVCQASEISEPIIANAARDRYERDVSHWLGEWREEEEEGTRWRRMQFREHASFADLFALYIDAILKVVKQDGGHEWQCYPVICIDKVTCCDGESEWLEAHGAYMATICNGGPSKLRESAIAELSPKNRSLVPDHSVFVTATNSLRIAWTESDYESSFIDHLQLIVPIEITLLQHWQLRNLESRLHATDERGFDVQAVQHEAIYGLREYRQSSLQHGTAIELTEHLLGAWRTERLHARIIDSLDQLQQLAAMEQTRQSASRANRLAAAAVVVALAVGLPAIEDTMEIAKKIPEDGLWGTLAWPLKHFANQGDLGYWKLYIVLLGTVTAAYIALLLKRYRFGVMVLRRAGYSWQQVTIASPSQRSEEGADSDG